MKPVHKHSKQQCFGYVSIATTDTDPDLSKLMYVAQHTQTHNMCVVKLVVLDEVRSSVSLCGV